MSAIQTVSRYVCTDGREFSTMNGAEYHQGEIVKSEKANAILEAGGSVADVLRGSDWNYDIPAVLEQLTKQSKLVVSFWQCIDDPVYGIYHFTASRKVHLWGGKAGWPGYYGGDVTLTDLQRYALNPNNKLSP